MQAATTTECNAISGDVDGVVRFFAMPQSERRFQDIAPNMAVVQDCPPI